MSGAETGGVATSTDILIVVTLCKKLLVLTPFASIPIPMPGGVFLRAQASESEMGPSAPI
jgi:hypothetical protein